MRDGYRIIDIDTHVQPALEVLQRYAGSELRERWSELEPYITYNQPVRPDMGDYDHPTANLSVASYTFDRTLGHKGKAVLQKPGGRSGLEGHVSKTHKQGPELGVLHDNSAGRLRAMDREGVDVDVIIPGTFASASTGLDVWLHTELCRAYNRYIVDYCSADPDRLKATIQVPAADPEVAAQEIKTWSNEKCVGAVTVQLPEGLPVDDPDLHPIWRAMDEADLPLLHHSFFYEPPYFPGYRDIWGNVVVARSAAHPWGAQRLVAYLILSGLFDQYPNLRVGFAEVGAGWIPFWVHRLSGQVDYMRGSVPDLKHDPVEYARMGRIRSGLEYYEPESIARGVIDALGEDVLMYQSDFPHPQARFPDSPADVLGWTTIGESAKQKLMSGNAEQYLRML